MQKYTRIIILCGVFAAVILIGLAVALIVHVSIPEDLAGRLKHWEFFVSVFEKILIGFIGGLLGFLLPEIFREGKHKRERIEKSRVAYVEATTAERYLVSKIAGLSYSDSIALIEDVHRRKNLAETYDELDRHLKIHEETHTQWHGRLCTTFDALLGILEDSASEWDSLPSDERLERIRRVIPSPSGMSDKSGCESSVAYPAG